MIIQLLASAVATIAAFYTFNKVKEERHLQEQYKQVSDAAARLSTGTSKYRATVLVLGFQNHGRSSFINTVFRVLYREDGPLLLRAETSPSKSQKTTTTQRVLRVKNKFLRYPKYLMNLIDTPAFATVEDVDDNAIRAVLRGRSEADSVSEIHEISKHRNVLAPECVILVTKCQEACLGAPAWDRLSNLAKIIREEGLQFVVVLTHSKEAKKEMDLQELMRDVAMRAGTDFVQYIENYVADTQHGARVSNNFDTHNKTLSIVRQCLEYVKQHRNVTIHKSGSADQLQGSYESSASD
eukprot:Gb_24120 [translate_table: standard]